MNPNELSDWQDEPSRNEAEGGSGCSLDDEVGKNREAERPECGASATEMDLAHTDTAVRMFLRVMR